jgi:hypothetical protein
MMLLAPAVRRIHALVPHIRPTLDGELHVDQPLQMVHVGL